MYMNDDNMIVKNQFHMIQFLYNDVHVYNEYAYVWIMLLYVYARQ